MYPLEKELTTTNIPKYYSPEGLAKQAIFYENKISNISCKNETTLKSPIPLNYQQKNILHNSISYSFKKENKVFSDDLVYDETIDLK
jgi:hypothetical protein